MSTLTITITSGTTAGQFTLTVSGTSAPISDTNTVSLTVLTPLAPSSVALESPWLGPASGGAANLATNDNASYYQAVSINPAGAPPRAFSWYGAFSGIPASPTALAITYDGNICTRNGSSGFVCTPSSPTRTQTISIWSWTQNLWIQIDSRSVGASDVLIPGPTAAGFISAPAPLDRFVGTGGNVGQVRVRIRSEGGGGSTEYISRGDWLRLGHG
jgi:hypothetical protein